jgi:hypothetical protein
VLLGGLKNSDYLTVSEAAQEARARVAVALARAKDHVAVLRKGQQDVAAVIPGEELV